MPLGIIITIVVLLVFALLVALATTYNSLVRCRNKVEEAFATMDVYLKQRWDLVPNLVETVKGYAKHEKTLLEEIVKMRNGSYNKMSNEEKLEANSQLTRGISKIMALAEDYPELRASDNFKELSTQLTEIEKDIASSRKYYNGAVKEMNNKVDSFPTNLVAGIMGFERQKSFTASQTERENVKVEF